MNKTDSASGGRIRVLIVDDHAMVRQGLRTFLELQDSSALPIEVVGEARNGVEAVELAHHTQPDIVLLDLVMPEMDGIHAAPKIIGCSPRSRVIILTSFGEEDKVLPAIRAGAQGYLQGYSAQRIGAGGTRGVSRKSAMASRGCQKTNVGGGSEGGAARESYRNTIR